MDDYKITGSPETIWLNYGDIDRDDTHEKCARDGEVTWCEEAVFYSDIKYVRADIAQAREAELMAKIRDFLCAWDSCRSSGEWPVRRLEELRAALATTPAQSLARYHNEVLEKAAKLAEKHDSYILASEIRAIKEAK